MTGLVGRCGPDKLAIPETIEREGGVGQGLSGSCQPGLLIVIGRPFNLPLEERHGEQRQVEHRFIAGDQGNGLVQGSGARDEQLHAVVAGQ